MAFVVNSALVIASAGELTVSTDFEGASANVIRIDQQERHVVIRPAGDPQFGWPCWWYFRLDGIQPGETITIEVSATDMKMQDGKPLGSDWALPHQAAYSIDGKHWQQTKPAEPTDGHATWTLPIDSPRAWFAWGPPFVPRDAERLVQHLDESSPHATSFSLCRTRAGRNVPALTITQGGDDDGTRPVIWVQARQHAWESGGSWVGRGFAEWLTSDDARAVALRKRTVTYYVPIMDIDNTATGNGGKWQVPHDHNRDWYDDAKWNSVKAAMRMLTAFDRDNRLMLFVDSHNPGAKEKLPYFFIGPPELVSKQRNELQQRFVDACRQEMIGPLPLDKKMPSTGPSYHPLWKRIAANWINQNTREHVVGLTLETCWNTPHSNTTGYRTVGRQLGLGMERYLRDDPLELPSGER